MLRRTFLQSAAAAGLLGGFNFSGLAFAAADGADDPLLAPWTGDFGGMPPFDKVKVELLKPALLKAMDLNRAEIAAIAASGEPATFENTIVALEKAGGAFDRVGTLFNVFSSTMSDDEIGRAHV